jgi:hypothetical protein
MIMPTTRDEWRDSLEGAMIAAGERLLADGDVRPIVAIELANGKVLIDAAWPDQRAEEVAWRIVKLAVVAWDAVAVFYIIHGQISAVRRLPEETEEQFIARAPNDASPAYEALVGCVTFRTPGTAERHTLLETRKVKRDAGGSVTDIEAEDHPDEDAQGYMAELFPDWVPTIAQRDAARAILSEMGLPNPKPATMH